MNERGEERIEKAARGQANAERIHTDRPDEVSPDNASRSARDGERFGKLQEVVSEQDHICTLARYIGARAHRHAHLSFNEGRRVIDPIANHCHATPGGDQLFDTHPLIFGQQIGRHFRYVELLGHDLGHRLGIARQEDCLDPHRVDRLDRLKGLRAQGIGDYDGAEQLAGARHEDLGRLGVTSQKAGGHRYVMFAHQRLITDQHALTVEHGIDAATGGVAELIGLAHVPAERSRMGNYRLSQRVLGAQFRRCGAIEYPGGLGAFGGDNGAQLRPPKVSVPVLSSTTVFT